MLGVLESSSTNNSRLLRLPFPGPDLLPSLLPDFCGPPEPVYFPLPGGIGPHATADVTFSFPGHSSCTLSLAGLHTDATHFRLSLESNATHVLGSVTTDLGGSLERKNFSGVPFPPGLFSTWSLFTYPDGLASFLDYQEHFRLSSAQDIPFADLGSLRIIGATVANASLGRLGWIFFWGGTQRRVPLAFEPAEGGQTLMFL